MLNRWLRVERVFEFVWWCSLRFRQEEVEQLVFGGGVLEGAQEEGDAERVLSGGRWDARGRFCQVLEAI